MDIASLGIKITTQGAQEAARDLTKLEKQGALTERAADNLRRGWEAAGRSLGLSLAGGIATAGLLLQKYVANTIEAEKVQAQLAARIKSTGGAAGLALGQLNDMADALQRATTFDDESINGAQAMLLTFTRIGSEVFPRATEAVLDMATALGGDLKSAALQIGKALNDPVQGITALSRAGVQFSEDQKEVIKQLVETGRTADAQKLILKELETQMGGAARAARNTLGGSLQALKNSFDNLLEGDTSEGGLKGTRDTIESLNDSLNDPELKRGIDSLASGLLSAANAAIQAAGKLGGFIGQYRQWLAERGFVEGKEIADLEARRDKLVEFKSTWRAKVLFNTSDIDKEITRVDNLIEEKIKAARGNGATVLGSTSTPGTGIWANINQPAAVVGGGGSGGARSARASATGGDAAREMERWAAEQARAGAELQRTFDAIDDARFSAMEGWAELTAQLDGPLKVAELDHARRLAQIEQLGRDAGKSAEEIAVAKAKETAAYNEATAAIQAQAEAMANPDLIDALDGVRQVGYDFLVDLPREGKKAWSNLLDDLTDMLTRWAAKGLIDQLFGPQGTNGQGSAAGGWAGQLLGAFFGSSSGSSQGSLLDLFQSGSTGFGFRDGSYTGDGPAATFKAQKLAPLGRQKARVIPLPSRKTPPSQPAGALAA